MQRISNEEDDDEEVIVVEKKGSDRIGLTPFSCLFGSVARC